MKVGAAATPPFSSLYSRTLSNTQFPPGRFCRPPWTSEPAVTLSGRPLLSVDLHLRVLAGNASPSFPSIGLKCNCSAGPGGEGDSRSVLDAFFLGKAFAEAVNEHIESTVGEFLSRIGRLQAEQQKQVQDFQEEVLERAKRAKEKAAREALEAKVNELKASSTGNITTATTTNGAATEAVRRASEVPTTQGNTGVDERDPFLDLVDDERQTL